MSLSPVLDLLGNYGEKGLKRFVRGVEVERLLQGRYSNLVDLLPDTETACLSDAVVGDRAPLTHRRLRQFIQNEFDLGAFGLNKGDRVGVLLPNGPELALTILAVVSNWCAAPINPTNSSAEIRSMGHMKA
jgi:non-ribosomal peptide synthetase component E (peptide arylation enzyme)